jgi:hypothetical protein
MILPQLEVSTINADKKKKILQRNGLSNTLSQRNNQGNKNAI